MPVDLLSEWGLLLAAVAVAFVVSFAVGVLVVVVLIARASRSAVDLPEPAADDAVATREDPGPVEALPRVVDPVA